MKKSSGTLEIKVGKHHFAVSNPDKIIYPKPAIAKAQVLEYYQKIAKYMVPYLKDRPLSMQRFPDGITDAGFYQKDASEYFPDWIETFAVKREAGGKVRHVVVNNAATLVYIATQLCLVFHRWLSKTKKVNSPDLMIFDLDPSGKDFNQVRFAALKLKTILESLGLVPFVMTTGSRGLHVVIPLKASEGYDEVRSFARDLAQLMVHEDPEHLTLEMRKAKRGNKIFVDYLRNGFGATAVTPYSLRARPGAPVATPLKWPEVSKKTLKPDQWNIKNIFIRLKKGDPWKNINKYAKPLGSARKKLDKLIEKD
jgi:bifunctional non-homologous end joining protein LigD